MIQDVCLIKVESSAFYCPECEARIAFTLDFIGNEDTIVEAVAELQNSDFCLDIYDEEGEEECKGKIAYVLPLALPALSAADRSWVPLICKDFGCKQKE